jgi:hypothetical protein
VHCQPIRTAVENKTKRVEASKTKKGFFFFSKLRVFSRFYLENRKSTIRYCRYFGGSQFVDAVMAVKRRFRPVLHAARERSCDTSRAWHVTSAVLFSLRVRAAGIKDNNTFIL